MAQVSNPSVYGLVAASPSPCPPALRRMEPRHLGYPFHDGANTVAVCASDLATIGNPNTTCSPPVTVTVDNSCTESTVPGGEALSAQFAGSSTEAETVAYGTPAEVSGTLRDDAGDPVSGATNLRQVPDARNRRSAGTGGGGEDRRRRALRLRRARRPRPRTDVGLSPRLLPGRPRGRYFANVAPSLKVNPPKLRNGKRVRLWGELPGPAAGDRGGDPAGEHQGLQALDSPSAARPPNDQGAFESAYLFDSTTRRTLYRFRAIVPRQDHYPYVEGGSSAVSVLVEPGRRKHHRHHQ